MHFAPINSSFPYWQKQTQPLFPDLFWNIPEQKSEQVTVIGGNSQTFSAPVKISEYLEKTFPFTAVSTILPDVLRAHLPPLPNFHFVKSTANGAIANSLELRAAFDADHLFLAGDFSKNSETAIALTETLKSSLTSPNHQLKHCLITRDAADLLAPSATEWLNFPEVILVVSLAQLQKIFRAAYYPKMIMLSQPLVPTIETLHKFTLTYPLTILTFHQENIIIASHGEITSTNIVDTQYSPIMLWSGELAAHVLALNIYNPNQPLAATTAAVLYQ